MSEEKTIQKKASQAILGLVIEESQETIDETFGGNQETMHQIREGFAKWLAFEKHESYTQAWADFLNSEVFKKIGWKPQTPNDYFLLGWVFSGGKYKYSKMMNAMTREEGGDLKPCDLLRILRGL